MRAAILSVGAAMVIISMMAGACGSGQKASDGSDTITVNHLPDTIRVATLYSPTGYFIYREEQMGYDYTLVADLAREKGMTLNLTIANSLEQAVEMLDSGDIDLIAYEVPVTSEYKEHIYPCGPINYTSQVLVQPRASKERVNDVTDLVGREIYVERASKYQQRLEHLNEELGGGIIIKTVDRDTLITEDLIEMVSTGEIPLTVVDSDVARLNKTYFPDLDITLELSFKQRSSWGVSNNKKWLGDSINAWIQTDVSRRENDMLLKRYFELSKSNFPSELTFDFSSGRISPYDNLFKHYAKDLGWDWRLLAAQGYVESKFDNSVTSWAGARGIMQIMPSTARANGFSADALTNPETSIRVAVKVLKTLDRMMARYVSDREERRKFVLAAYNAGGAHIIDAIELAKKYGKTPDRWFNNVADALLLKSNSLYYNDPVCKYGYFRGKQTTAYVEQVLAFYNRSKQKIKL